MRVFWFLFIFACFVSISWCNEESDNKETISEDETNVLPWTWFSPKKVYQDLLWSDHSFLRARSNAMNPNHPTYNPTAQPRGTGSAARHSRSQAARANENIRNSRETTESGGRRSSGIGSALGGGLFGGTTVFGRKITREGSNSLDKETVKEIATGAGMGAGICYLTSKSPLVGPGIAVIHSGWRYVQRTSDGKSKAVVAAEEGTEAIATIGVCTVASAFGGFLGSFVPGLGSVVGVGVGGLLCGAASTAAEGVGHMVGAYVQSSIQSNDESDT